MTGKVTHGMLANTRAATVTVSVSLAAAGDGMPRKSAPLAPLPLPLRDWSDGHYLGQGDSIVINASAGA